MRFASRSPQYTIQIDPPTSRVHEFGVERVSQGLDIQFKHIPVESLDEHEIAYVRSRFKFEGIHDGASGDDYLSLFDTDIAAVENHWDDELKKRIEDTLVRIEPTDSWFVRLPKKAAALPWANFDQLTDPAEIAKVALATGAVEGALEYEQENRNRAEVIAALQNAGSEDETVETEEQGAEGEPETPAGETHEDDEIQG